MQTSVLIIGQGLCGTWLSYYLEQTGIPFLVIDDNKKDTASKIASGIINPVTGRRLVKTWMIDEIMPFAVKAYQQFQHIITSCDVLDFFAAPDVEMAFYNRVNEAISYVSIVENKEWWRTYFHFDFGVGNVSPCYLVDVNAFIAHQRKCLEEQQLLVEVSFDENDLLIKENSIHYRDITAQRIIYCNGIAAAASKYFQRLPFVANKGEALIAAIPNLPATHIFKKGMSLVPWKENYYWIGSTYEWKFEHVFPTALFRENAEKWLQSFCKMPYEIVDHLAAVRPATVERRPFIGFHPLYPQVGIFNGMGTKGVSLAPYFAKQFADVLSCKASLLPEVDIKRFEKILCKQLKQ